MDTATSKTTVQTVVILLGLFAILALGGVVYLVDTGAPVASVAIVSTPMGVALGSLGTLLASTRSPVAAQLPVVTPPEKIADVPMTAWAVDVPDVPRTTTLAEPLALEDHAQA